MPRDIVVIKVHAYNQLLREDTELTFLLVLLQPTVCTSSHMVAGDGGGGDLEPVG